MQFTPNILPTIFRGINQYSGPVTQMINTNNQFNASLGTTATLFGVINTGVSSATSQMMGYVSATALATTAIAGLIATGGELGKYEKDVAKFRTIVSELNDLEFSKFENEIKRIATGPLKPAARDVANSFEMIAGLNAKFAETAEGLGAVSNAAVILGRASGDELGVAAQNLTGIMNQFSLSADQANRSINVLAAGQAVGAASIRQTQEAFTQLGPVAAQANMSLEQSVAIVQVLGKYSQFGADAGARLRTSISLLQATGVGYKKGLFDIVEALETTKMRYDALRTAKQKDAYIETIFGKNQLATGAIMVNNIELFKEYTKSVTGTSEAIRAAEINTKPFLMQLEMMKNSFITNIVTSDGAKKGLEKLSDIAKMLTNNMDAIISVGGRIIQFWVAWKAILISTRIAMFAYNTYLGINIALTNASTLAIASNARALSVYNVVSKVSIGIQTAYAIATGVYNRNVNMSTVLNYRLAISARAAQIGMMGMLGWAGLLTAGIVLLTNSYNMDFEAMQRLKQGNEETESGFKKIAKPISDAEIALNRYNKAVEEFNTNQDFLKIAATLRKESAFKEFGFYAANPMRTISALSGLTPAKREVQSELMQPKLQDYGYNESGEYVNSKVQEAERTATTTNQKFTFEFVHKDQYGRTIQDPQFNTTTLSSTSTYKRP
jgi:TP901 family phage tail tape measure protein